MRPISTKLLAVGAVFVVLSSTGAQAHIGATGIVKERMDTMSAMGKAMGVIVDMIKGKTPHDAILARDSANVLHDHAIDAEVQYPDTDISKNGMGSQALPVVWQERAEFDKLLKDLQGHAEKLTKIAAMNDPAMLRSQFTLVVKTCSACHEKFRKPKQ